MPALAITSWKRPGVLVAAALLACVVGGCGSSSPPAPDPASLAPATAPFYLSAVVRPSGALHAIALADGRTLTHQANPFLGLLGALSLHGPGGHVGYAHVTPWLGERAGVFISASSAASVPTAASLLQLLERASAGGLFARPAAGGPPAAPGQIQGAVIVGVSDAARARAFLRAQLPAADRSSHKLDGVAWWPGYGGEAGAVVGRFMIVGSEAGVREAIETAHGARSVLQEPAYLHMRAGAPAGALAAVYANLLASAPAGSAEEPAGGEHGGREGAPASLAESPLGRTLALLGGRQLYASLVPQSGKLRVQIDALGPSQDPSVGESERAATAEQMLQQLPESSWLAAALADPLGDAARVLPLLAGALGEGRSHGRAPARHGATRRSPARRAGAAGPQPFGELAHALAALARSLGPPLSGDLAPFARIARALAPHDAQLRPQIASWAGPASLFVSGSSLLETNAGIVVSVTEAGAAKAAVSLIAKMLKSAGIGVEATTIPGAEVAVSVELAGLPVQLPLDIAYGHGRFVVGLGVSPVQDALAPSGTLGPSQQYRSAAASLGESLQPHVLLAVPQLLSLLDLFGASNTHALAPLTPYLHALSTLTAGTRPLGSGRRTIVVVGLQ